jgi:hypothetical protein
MPTADKALEAVARALCKRHRDVLAVLSDTTTDTPAMVHRRLSMWSLISVRHTLRELWQVGAATFDGEPCKRRYGRTPAGRAMLEAASPSLGADEGGV